MGEVLRHMTRSFLDLPLPSEKGTTQNVVKTFTQNRVQNPVLNGVYVPDLLDSGDQASLYQPLKCT
jgi:hypothetical protein